MENRADSRWRAIGLLARASGLLARGLLEPMLGLLPDIIFSMMIMIGFITFFKSLALFL